jgi:membrane protein YqaA with SNARE-associated domain
MAMFRNLYERAILWSAHPKAPWYLTFISFIEAIFFPVPPEVMLAPMSLAQPKKAFWFATLSLTGSMVGMFIGYALGHFAIDLAMPLVEKLGFASQFDDIKHQADTNGFWLLLLAGFTPIPFKIFTIASGAVGMPLLPFFFGALIGRGKRVYLVAAVISAGGEKAEAKLRQYIEPVGWTALILLAALVAYWVLK